MKRLIREFFTACDELERILLSKRSGTNLFLFYGSSSSNLDPYVKGFQIRFSRSTFESMPKVRDKAIRGPDGARPSPKQTLTCFQLPTQTKLPTSNPARQFILSVATPSKKSKKYLEISLKTDSSRGARTHDSILF